MTQILKTQDYELFVLHEFNRDVVNTKKLEKSMKIHGWLDAYPMHVEMSGCGKLIIKGGHHRFEVAKALCIPVKYVIINDTTVSIHDLEETKTIWSSKSYIQSYSRSGDRNYAVLNYYHNKSGIGLSLCASMLIGFNASSGSYVSNKIKSGTFKVKTTEHIDKVISVVDQLKQAGIEFATHKNLVIAISKVVSVDAISINRLLSQIKKHFSKIRKQPSSAGYLESIDTVYNSGTSNRIPLVFWANEEAKKRCVTNKNIK